MHTEQKRLCFPSHKLPCIRAIYHGLVLLFCSGEFKRSLYKDMKLYPAQSFTISTPLSSNEIKNEFGKFVEPKKYWRFFGGEKYFEGMITDNGFKVSRNISYRNSFLPMIYGTIKEGINGSTLTIKMSLHPFVLVFMIVWMSFAAIGAFESFLIMSSPKDFHPSLLIPFEMLLFGWGLVSVGFWPEASKSKKQIYKIFNTSSEPGA